MYGLVVEASDTEIRGVLLGESMRLAETGEILIFSVFLMRAGFFGTHLSEPQEKGFGSTKLNL